MPDPVQLQAQAEAQDQLRSLKAAVRDDVLNSETKSGLGSIGMGANPQQATNDADIWVPLFHAYDGRAVRVPLYMLDQKNSYLAQRFPYSTDIPPEHRGKQVWFLPMNKPEYIDEEKPFMCPFSAAQPEEWKAQMAEYGFRCDCRKGYDKETNEFTGFATAFEADYHAQRKHSRRWPAYQQALDRERSDRSNNQVAELIKAFTAASKEK